ncbi:MAG: DUF1329 domain-containing protein [Nevskiaceae bacterium]
MKRLLARTLLVAAALSVAAAAQAKVPQAEADRLKKDLTPMGAEKAASKDGAIPAWTGGLTTSPACYKGEGTRYCDPFAQDKPQFTITPANYQQYAARLSVGQMETFKKYPSYKMNVFASRRTFANPQFIYDATYNNALKASLGGNGEALVDAIMGAPFPIPKDGYGPIWNHKVRYFGASVQRWNNQFAVTTSGGYNQVKIREDVMFPYMRKGATPEGINNVIIYFLQIVTAPARLAGTITLVHETMDQIKEPRRAWQYNPGQKRLRRAPNIGYDNPGTASDGLRTNDQTNSYNGAMDRYTWKIVGKKDLYVPYNSYVLHDGKYKYADIMRKSHINQDLPRYELHRVWVVDSTTKPGTTHIYKRRTFYIDEDSWAIVVVDIYDRRDQLWRFQETHTAMAYDKPFLAPVGETIYDLQSNRYLAQAFNNEDPENVEKEFDDDYFSPTNVSKQAIK